MTEYFEFKKNEKMEYRRLGRSGLRVSCLSLGGWLTLGGTVKGDLVCEIIKCAWENGVNFIDTAEGYAGGQSEQEIGRCVKELNILRSDLVISTKVFWGQGQSPNAQGLSRKHVIEGLNASLERLQMDYVDVYFAHRPDPTVPMEEVVRAFNWCIEQGKAHYWGTSEWSAREIEAAHHVCAKIGLIKPIAEQAEHSLMRRTKAEGEFLPIYEEYGTKLTVFSALHCGFLTGKYNDGIPVDSRFAVHTEMDWLQDRVKGLASPEGQKDIEKVRRLTEVAKRLGVSVTQLSLAYISKMESTATIIMGCKTPAQMLEQLGALDEVGKIDQEVEKEVEEIFGNKPVPQTQYSIVNMLKEAVKRSSLLGLDFPLYFGQKAMPRRLTDRSLPPGLSAVSPDAGLFDELLETEKRLDWTMTRRRQEIYDTLNRGVMQTKRTLRVFMSHSVKNQSWQKSSSEEPKPEKPEEAEDIEKKEGEEVKTSLETGVGVPSWTFKLEGKLLHPEDMPKPKRWPVPQRKFSQLVRGLAIEMDRDPTVYADTNHVQWNADPKWGNYNLLGAYTAIPGAGETAAAGAASPSGATPLDGFTITRTGDVPIGLRITLNINHIPDRIKLSPALAPILGIQEDIKANILGAFWHYVKANGLQDKNDRKLIRLDERLKGVFKYESLNFQDIQALLAAHMQPADPLVLQYELGTHCLESTGADVEMTDSTTPAKPTPGGIGVKADGQSAVKAFDIELDMDDLWMRTKAADTIMSMQPDPVQIGQGVTAPPSSSFLAIQKADDEIKHNLQTLRSLRIRRDFFTALAAKPSTFIQNFVESQARDLEVILGNERAAEAGGAGGNSAGIRESDLANSEFFQGDWAPEAVAVHEGIRMGSAVAAMHHAAQQAQNLQGMGGTGMGPPGMQMPMR